MFALQIKLISSDLLDLFVPNDVKLVQPELLVHDAMFKILTNEKAKPEREGSR